MQILLANAKIMNKASNVKPLTTPLFQSTANDIAMGMAQLDITELENQLACNRKIAAENWQRYQHFHCAETMPAIMAYNGQAYKHLHAKTLTTENLAFAQQHLWITCFLYGLLRPMDAVVPYRMEHSVSLQTTGNIPLNQYWRNKLTDTLIYNSKADDGVIMHLSTHEYENLFDWKQVKTETKVIQPLFYVRKGGSLKMQAVWAKACRGAMTRYIIKNRITNTEDIKNFSYEGFEYNPNIGEELFPHFVREE